MSYLLFQARKTTVTSVRSRQATKLQTRVPIPKTGRRKSFVCSWLKLEHFLYTRMEEIVEKENRGSSRSKRMGLYRPKFIQCFERNVSPGCLVSLRTDGGVAGVTRFEHLRFFFFGNIWRKKCSNIGSEQGAVPDFHWGGRGGHVPGTLCLQN